MRAEALFNFYVSRILDSFSSYFWVALTVVALFTGLSSSRFISELVSHGKLVVSPDRYNLRVPKSWFSHFYIYGILAMILISPNRGSFGWTLAVLHLIRRLVEQIICFPNDGGSMMHGAAYMLGFLFYTMVALSVPNHPSSTILWFVGNAIQHVAHGQLFRNRMTNPSKTRPPETLLFRYMNCPHYFGEMLIYIGLSSCDRTESIACAVFVIVSLSVNWRNHSRWYSIQVE